MLVTAKAAMFLLLNILAPDIKKNTILMGKEIDVGCQSVSDGGIELAYY